MDVRLFLKNLFLKNTFIGWILLVSIVPIIIIIYLVTTASTQALHREINNNLTLIADKKISDIENFFAANKDDATHLARDLTVISDNPITLLQEKNDPKNLAIRTKLTSYLTNYVEQHRYIDILILSPDGKVVYSVKQPQLIGKDYSLMPLKKTELGKSFDNAKTLLETTLSDVEISDHEKVLYIASPIINEKDKLFGVLALKMSNADIEKVIMNTDGLGNTGETLVGTMKDGHIQPVSALRHISIENFTKNQDSFSPEFVSAFKDATIGKKGIGEFTDYRDESVLAVWRYLPSMRWGMLIKVDKDEVLNPIMVLKQNIFTLGLITLLMAMVVGYTISLKLQRQENQLLRLLSELEVARNDALDANRAKSAFLANMSHELRTPLNAIIGYSEMLIEDATDQGNAPLVDDLQKIRGAGKNLLDLINDVLDISKIEAGRMEVYIEKFSLASLLEDIRSLVVPLMNKKNNRFKLKFSKNIGDVQSDLIKLRQCLLNLLSNASKFTENGSITLNAKRLKQDDQDWIQFDVTDSGIGMSQEQQKKLFQAFSQVDASTTRKYGGTGLGLFLTQRFAQMLGGNISVESEIDQGSTFTLMIPAQATVLKEEEKIKKPDEAAPVTTATPSKTSTIELPTILVIDDDKRFHELINESLGHYFHLLHAYNGEAGIAMAKKQQPDAITLDVMMPGMDGWSVLGALRSDPKVFMIPVIMMTVTGDKDLGYALGATDFLNKPVNVPLLMNKLYQYMGKNLPNILIIEDDLAARSMLARTLRKAGMEVREVENGLLGLESIKSNKPSLILLDLIMPVMNGFEFLERLRHDKETADIPVIVITSKDLTEADREFLNGSVTSIIKKSAYHRDELINIIRQKLNESVQLTKNYKMGLIDHPSQKMIESVSAETIEGSKDMIETDLTKRLNDIHFRILSYLETIRICLKHFDENDVKHINRTDLENIINIKEGLKNLETKLTEFHAIIQQNNLTEEKLTILRHDMRNAINIIKGYSEIFSEKLEENKQTELTGYFAIIITAVNQIYTLTDLIKMP